MTVALVRSAQVEYGDFQTPPALAKRMVQVIERKAITYPTIVEPTCGLGNILFAAADHLPNVEMALGVEINSAYVAHATTRQAAVPVQVQQANFFDLDLKVLTSTLPQPILYIGNPPWVTNAAVGQLQGSNLPKKVNSAALSGLEALTGKSNFDVSEWIVLRLLESVAGTLNACVMLIKTSVARKIMLHAARHALHVTDFELYAIDAKREFDVSVSACLFYFRGSPSKGCYDYTAYTDLEGAAPTRHTYQDGHFVDDLAAYQRTQRYATSTKGNWRSGLKHDAAPVMELRKLGPHLVNASGQPLDLEPDLIYPLLKSSDIAKGHTTPRLYTIVTQKTIGESTESIKYTQPRTWAYLQEHRATFQARKSSIYKGKPDYSIFGVGDYSFAPYKIAISGLYKTLNFTLLEPHEGKSVMLDDTCYFLGFPTRPAALIHLAALQSEAATEFLTVRISWDDKRPIKKDVLDAFDILQFIKLNTGEVQAKAAALGVTKGEFKDWENQNMPLTLF